MSIPDGWTEVTNGDWGHGPVRFPDNVPVGAHYQNGVGARGVLTPDGVFKIEGISLDPPNRGKPDGMWWDYVEGETDSPTDFSPWIDPEPATIPPVVPETPAPESEPAASIPAPAPIPSVSVTQTTDGWLVRAEHKTGEIVTTVWADLRHAMLDAERWVRAHV